MPFERAPGSNPRGGPLSADGWKYVLEPAQKAQQTRKTGSPVQPLPAHRQWHTVVQCINGTGDHLRRGDVVEFNGSPLDPLDNASVWVNGVAVDLTHVGWGIALEPIAYNASAPQIGPVLALGACVAFVLITDESHQFATRANGSKTLVSTSVGSAKILHKPAGMLPEERECLVQIMDEGGDIVDIVQVDDVGTFGDVIIRDMSVRPAYQGKIRRYDASSDNLSDEGYCWILFVDDFGNGAWDTACVNGEFYGPAKYVGHETFDLTTLPTYTVRRGELMEMVQVYNSGGGDTVPSAGDVVAVLSEGYHEGFVVRYSGTSTLTAKSPCWIQFTSPFNGPAIQSKYYGPAKYAGIWDRVRTIEEVETHDRRPVFIIDHGEHSFPGRFDAGIADGASGTFSVYHPTTLTDSVINLTVSCHGDPIIEGKGFATFVGTKWFGANSECTTSEEI